MAENRVVLEALDGTNYKIWSNCMEIYLLSHDLWDVIEQDAKADESSKAWRRKNASALHAIHVSCSKDTLSEIGELKSAKKVWDLLRSIFNIPDTEESLEIKPEDDGIDYCPFVEATEKGDSSAMKQFLRSHPKATTVPVGNGRTALHYLILHGNIDCGGVLVDEMTPEELEITDDEGFTAFAYLSIHPGGFELLQRMVARNANLPNIGEDYRLPIVRACLKGSDHKDTVNYLYNVTRKDVLNPDHSYAGGYLLFNCISSGLFDIASDIVGKFPMVLQIGEGVENPICELAKYFSTLKYRNTRDESRTFKLNHWLSRKWEYVKQYYTERIFGEYDQFTAVSDKLAYDEAYTFLQLVCAHVSIFDDSTLARCVHAAMIEASKDGIVEFVCEMLKAHPKLIEANLFGRGFISYAIEYRQEKVYSRIIYSFIEQKDELLYWGNNDERNNILHLVAKSPPLAAIDRTSGPAMAMQREVLWFEEIWSMASHFVRHARNREGLTPRDMFAQEHKDLISKGERAMKETANSAAFVGALILTVTFTAAFTVPGGNNGDGLPVLLRKALFKIFVVCDALSLYSAIASILAILGILAPSFAETDFLFKSPRRLMIGLWTLWFSLLTMMLGFCAVLALTLDGLFRYILPIMLLLFTPVILVRSPIFSLCLEIYRSTYATSLFDKNTSLRDQIEKKKMAMLKGADAKKLPEKEIIEVSSNPSTGNEIV